MAIVLLLAAPKNQRTANPNAQFLIHEVQGGVSGSTTAVERYAEEMRDLQERILDIFADRTGADRAELSAAMQEDKMRDSKYMLEHGFIGAINEYNTNQIGNKTNLLDELKTLFARAAKAGVQNAAPSEDPNALRHQLATLTAERDQFQNPATETETAHTQLSYWVGIAGHKVGYIHMQAFHTRPVRSAAHPRFFNHAQHTRARSVLLRVNVQSSPIRGIQQPHSLRSVSGIGVFVLLPELRILAYPAPNVLYHASAFKSCHRAPQMGARKPEDCGERGPRRRNAGGRFTAWPGIAGTCLLYTSPSPRDRTRSRMPSSA